MQKANLGCLLLLGGANAVNLGSDSKSMAATEATYNYPDDYVAPTFNMSDDYPISMLMFPQFKMRAEAEEPTEELAEELADEFCTNCDWMDFSGEENFWASDDNANYWAQVESDE